MCGRYYIDDGEFASEMQKILDEINDKYRDTPQGAAMKTGEIFPSYVAPVLVSEHESVRPALMTWGYPRWQGSGVIINARSETAAEKPLFRSSISHRRCIVPSSGFYEWDHAEGRPKTKFLLRRPESPMLYMAGLYATFDDPSGINYAAYVILTVAANASVSSIHDRMPMILDPRQNDPWLHDEHYARTLLHEPCKIELAMQRA